MLPSPTRAGVMLSFAFAGRRSQHTRRAKTQAEFSAPEGALYA